MSSKYLIKEFHDKTDQFFENFGTKINVIFNYVFYNLKPQCPGIHKQGITQPHEAGGTAVCCSHKQTDKHRVPTTDSHQIPKYPQSISCGHGAQKGGDRENGK